MNFERLESLIKTIVDGIVVKRGFLADSFESDTSRKLYHKYKNAVEKTDKIEYHDLLSVDFTGTNLVLEENIEAKRECLADPKKVYSFLDEIELEQMLTNIRTRVINTYVEKNPYYRILMGLPSLVDSVYLYVGSEYSSQIDITKPIHEMNESEIKILYDAGVLTELAETYPTKQYIGYLHRKVDLITARDADDFTILKMHHIEGEEHICDYFLEAYNNHLDNFIRRHINIFYQRTTDYYESIVCMILLWATRMDTIREMSAGIDYDYYDDYDLAAIFQDYSIKMNDLVPRELRIDIAKNINLLVRNRGTNEVMKNLSDIFGLSNIYNYVIHKVYNNFGESQIRCHAVPVGDMKNTRKYLMREYGFISYGKLVENDRTWTDRALSNMSTKEMRKLEEGQEYVNIYDKLMQKDFSYIHSKYIAIDNIIDMGQTSLDFSLFFNYMLEYSGIYNTVFVHHRYSNAKINILNMYVYLCALMSTKYKFVDTIASNASEVKYILALNDKINFRAVPYDKGVSNNVTVYLCIYEDIFVHEDVQYLNANNAYETETVPYDKDTMIQIYLAKKGVTIPPQETIINPLVISNDIAGIDSTEIYFTEGTQTVTMNTVSSGIEPLVISNDIAGIDSTEIYFTGEESTEEPTEEPDIFEILEKVYIYKAVLDNTNVEEPPVEVTIETVVISNDIAGIDSTEIYFTESAQEVQSMSLLSETNASIQTSGIEPIVISNDIAGIDSTEIYFTGTEIPVEPPVEEPTPPEPSPDYSSTIEIMDLVELFEVNFAGTEYANILANWLSFNPTGTFEEFIDVFCHDRKLVYAFKQIMRETYDHEQYNVAKIAYDYSTRVAAKTSVFGNVVTYSDYLKNTAPKLHEYFISLKENTTEDKWSEVFANEITYCLSIFRDLIDSLDNVFYKDSFNFIEDLRDTQINELKNVLSYLVQYFSSMTMTVRDPNFKYELGDIDDHYLAREEQFKARSDKRSNDFEHAEERLFLYRKRNIDDERFVIKERVMVKYNNLKYRVIGGDNE